MAARWTSEDKATVLRMMEEEVSYAAIGEALGRSYGQITGMVGQFRKKGLLPPGRRRAKPRDSDDATERLCRYYVASRRAECGLHCEGQYCDAHKEKVAEPMGSGDLSKAVFGCWA